MLDDEQRQLRGTAREFALRELEPHAERWDREREFPREAVRRLAELGFFGLLLPEAEGGSGFGAVGFCLAVEEISRAVPALGLLLSIHNGPVCHLVRSAGSAAVRERWLPRLVAGEVLGAFALSEPQAGSDVAGVTSRYRITGGRDGGGFVLEGAKEWVSGAGVARLAVVFARRTAEGGSAAAAPPGDAGAVAPPAAGGGLAHGRRGGRGAGGLSAFLVDLASEGIRLGPREETMGLRAAPVAGLVLEGVRVDRDHLLGSEGEGFALALDALALGRLGIAAQSLGIAGRCIDLAVAYASERRQFGRPVAEFQGVRLPLADLSARLEAVRALVYRTAVERDSAGSFSGSWNTNDSSKDLPRLKAESGELGGDFAVQAAMAKLVASELAMAAALQAVQAYGGYGYVKDYPVERFFRDAKACQICEGTNEIQRIVIAKRLFGH